MREMFTLWSLNLRFIKDREAISRTYLGLALIFRKHYTTRIRYGLSKPVSHQIWPQTEILDHNILTASEFLF